MLSELSLMFLFKVLGNHECQLLYCGEMLGLIDSGTCRSKSLTPGCYRPTNYRRLKPKELTDCEYVRLALKMVEDDWKYVCSFPLYHRIDDVSGHDFIVVHAGLIDGVALNQQVILVL